MPHPTYPAPMAGMLKSALTAIGLFIAVGAFAQHEPEKEIVIINPFTHTSIVSQAVGDNVRAGVLSGFADRGGCALSVVKRFFRTACRRMTAGRKLFSHVKQSPAGTFRGGNH